MENFKMIWNRFGTDLDSILIKKIKIVLNINHGGFMIKKNDIYFAYLTKLENENKRAGYFRIFTITPGQVGHNKNSTKICSNTVKLSLNEIVLISSQCFVSREVQVIFLRINKIMVATEHCFYLV